MAKAVLNCKKIPTPGDARRLAGHNNRSNPPSNADASRSARWLMPDPESDIWDRIQNRVAQLPKALVRSNSVQAVSVLLSASPDYFGDWKEGDEKTQAWVDASMAWAKKEFGDLIVGAWAHFDEKTPHIHIHVVPGTPDGRLSAKERFGPRALSRFQTEYARSVEHLGIERGVKGSRATHKTTRQWYADRDKSPEPPKIPPPPLMMRENARLEWSQNVNLELAKHQQSLVDKAQGRHLAEQKAKEMAATAEAKERELQSLREERNRLRDINLSLVLEAAGWERDPDDKNQWLHPGGAAAGRISIKGQKWYDHAAGRGAGGAIDLAMHAHGFTKMQEAVGWLRDEFGSGAAEGAYRARAAARAARVVEQAPRPYQRPPEAAPEATGALERWLIQIRKIQADLARSLIRSGAVFASQHGRWLNAVFPFQGGRGAEVRGITDTGFRGNAPGSRPMKDFWQHATGPRPTRLIVAESPLDALAYHQLHPGPDSTLVSTAGAKSTPPDGLMELAGAHDEIVVAYDQDAAGAKAGQQLARRLGGQYAPPKQQHKDWNDALMASQQQQQPAAAPGPAPAAGPRL